MAKKEKKYSGRSGAAARASGRNVDRPDIQARKSAAQSMQRAGVQSLSGLSGSQGQVARFKTEQNQLRNEYNDKNTSDDRKEEIVKDLRGVSRDLNDQSRAAALNQVIREFGPGSITNTGGIMGSDAGARFQQLRGNPNFYQDGRPGLETFVGNQGAFKTGDKNLFKQVHHNPLKILLGAATQAGNISPMGLVRNIEKIRTGQPLIDMSFMDRNKSESPSRMKDFYSAYMEGMNKKIADAKSSKNAEQFDAVPTDPQFKDVEGKLLSSVDDAYGGAGPGYDEQLAKEILFGVADEEATGDPSNREDLQDEMDRTIFNQYSLLQDDSLADTLLDDTEETDLAEAINPESEQKRGMDPKNVGSSTDNDDIRSYLEYLQTPGEEDPGYEQEFMDTYGYRFDRNFANRPEVNPDDYGYYDNISLKDRKDMIDEIQGRNTYYSQDLSELNERTPVSNIAPNIIEQGTMGYPYGFEEPVDTIFSDVQTEMPKLGNEIRTVDFRNLGYKDGGSVNTYDVLKLINDTMNDG